MRKNCERSFWSGHVIRIDKQKRNGEFDQDEPTPLLAKKRVEEEENMGNFINDIIHSFI